MWMAWMIQTAPSAPILTPCQVYVQQWLVIASTPLAQCPYYWYSSLSPDRGQGLVVCTLQQFEVWLHVWNPTTLCQQRHIQGTPNDAARHCISAAVSETKHTTCILQLLSITKKLALTSQTGLSFSNHCRHAKCKLYHYMPASSCCDDQLPAKHASESRDRLTTGQLWDQCVTIGETHQAQQATWPY